MILLVQSLSHSNQPYIVLRMQLLPSCSSQPYVLLLVQILLHSNFAHAAQHPERPCLMWLGRQRPHFCSCRFILLQAQLDLFQPCWTLVHCTNSFIGVSAWVAGTGYSTGDKGLKASGLTCGWIGVADQQACTGALQYSGFKRSDCAR